MRNTTQLVKDKLTLDLGASYMRQYSRNPLVQGLYHNPLIAVYLFPRGDDIRKYQIYERYDATAGYKKQFWPLEFITGVENPWWVVNRQALREHGVALHLQRHAQSGTSPTGSASWAASGPTIRR